MRLLAAGLLAANAFAIWATPAAAHSPYMDPNVFDVGQRNHVTVQGSFTEIFFEPEIVMEASDYHVVGPDGAKTALKPIYARDVALIEAPTPMPGTYRISSGQRTGRSAKAALVKDEWVFFDPRSAPPAGAQAVDMQSLTLADVFVSKGAPSTGAMVPRGAGLEFKPLTHPNEIFAGDAARFQVLYDGKPLGGQTIELYRGADRYAETKTAAEIKTDGEGVFTVTPKTPGRYLIQARHRVGPAAAGEAAHSYTYTLTFEAMK